MIPTGYCIFMQFKGPVKGAHFYFLILQWNWGLSNSLKWNIFWSCRSYIFSSIIMKVFAESNIVIFGEKARFSKNYYLVLKPHWSLKCEKGKNFK